MKWEAIFLSLDEDPNDKNQHKEEKRGGKKEQDCFCDGFLFISVDRK